MELQEYRDKCEKRIGWALQELGRRPGSHELQSMARLIVDATTGPYRYFHTPDHLFMVAGEEDPVEVLAGLYHDLLYFQVDKSIFLNLASMVAGVVRQDGDHLVIHAEEMLKDDVCVQLVLAVFGFKPGETLQPFAGQNEFLSALAAMEQLRPYLSLADLARVTVCIELTIPFRQPPDESHPGAAEGLFQRLCAANQQLKVGLSNDEQEEAVRRAVRLALRDVSGFGYDVYLFMDNTWSLLPETNHSLLIPTSFSLRDYRVSLQKTYGFLSNLNADVIYPTFRGEPALETHAALTDRARYNLEVSRLYLAAKLVALGVVEALALRSAPHTPVALLLGEDPGTIPGRAEPEPFSLVGEHPPAFNSKVEEDVYGLLATGRTQKTSYDLNNSPLAANFFAILGPAGISVRINSAEAFFAEEITGDEYIALFPPELVAPIKERITKLMELRIAAVNRAP